MTQNNAAVANVNTQATDAKEPTKMDLARPIFREIYSQGYKLSEGCKSQRAEFIKRAMAEAGMTKNGAATYFQNLTNEAKGEKLYKYGSKKSTKAGEQQTTEGANQALDAANANNGGDVTEVGVHRWMVVNAAGEEINSFPSRDKAKAAAKTDGLDWQDRQAQKGE